MKVAILVLGLLALATTAFAWDPSHVNGGGPVNVPNVRDAFYCQSPSGSWNASNASAGFQSEMADDIPNDWVGRTVNQVTFYVAQWGGGPTPPGSFVVNFYNGACPPGQTAVASFDIPWGELNATFVYQSSWYVWQITANLPTDVTIVSNMSIGGYSNNNWGQNPPYMGLVICDTISGCGQGYEAGATWGCPRWSLLSCMFGTSEDVAYCLGGGVTATQPSTWGQIRSLYR